MTDSVTVVVASTNPVKVQAARAAFERRGASAVVTGAAVDSGVADQPYGDDETLRGARSRAAAARREHPDADFCVGFEGGVDRIDGSLLAFAWVAVNDRRGCHGESRSAALPLPPAISRRLEAGEELGSANDRVFATVNSKQQGGAFGLLTDGLLTREGVYRDTLLLALVPLLHELWQDDQPSSRSSS